MEAVGFSRKLTMRRKVKGTGRNEGSGAQCMLLSTLIMDDGALLQGGRALTEKILMEGEKKNEVVVES